MVKQFMPKAGEAILALFSKLGGNMNNVLGSRSNITFLGKGKNTEAFLDSDINVEEIGVLGKNKILEDENKELLEQLMGSNVGNKPSRIFLLIFGITFALGVLGSTKLITLSTASIYNRMIVPKSL